MIVTHHKILTAIDYTIHLKSHVFKKKWSHVVHTYLHHSFLSNIDKSCFYNHCGKHISS